MLEALVPEDALVDAASGNVQLHMGTGSRGSQHDSSDLSGNWTHCWGCGCTIARSAPTELLILCPHITPPLPA
jgi:hypothetical protein